MAASAGALYAAEYGGWSFAFSAMACLMAVGALAGAKTTTSSDDDPGLEA
jgi:hypothetical protein